MTLVKAVENNSYELSPDQHRQIYEASSSGQGEAAIQKYSKEELLAMHYKNIDLLKKNQPVIREFVLPIAYAPSTISLDELQKVCQSIHNYRAYCAKYSTDLIQRPEA